MLEMRAIELKEEINNLKTLCIEEMINNGGIENVNEQDFKAFKSTLKLIDSSIRFMQEEAEMIDEMDKKLNKILEKLEKGNKKEES